MINFEHQEDREYFEKLLLTEDKMSLEKYKTLFDFRPLRIKRREFNYYRNENLNKLIEKHGKRCMLRMECCDLDSGISIDHLIPLSTNKLNKELRNLKPAKFKKIKSQSFGSNHMNNLIIACTNCNNHKKHKILDRNELLEILIEKEKKGKMFQI